MKSILHRYVVVFATSCVECYSSIKIMHLQKRSRWFRLDLQASKHKREPVKPGKREWERREVKAMTTARRTKCECTDPGCPVHQGESKCERWAAGKLYRVDWADGDRTGTAMCQACAMDAMDSGAFRTAGERE